MLIKLMTLLCYAMLCYVLCKLFVLSDTGNSSATSPLLPSSTKIDDVYICHAANELPSDHWSRGPALEAAIGSCSRRLCSARYISEGLAKFRFQTAIY